LILISFLIFYISTSRFIESEHIALARPLIQMLCRNLTLVTILIVSLIATSTLAFPFLPRTGIISSAFTSRPLIRSSSVDGGSAEIAHPGEPWGSPTMYYKLAVSAALVLGGGVFAGWVFVYFSLSSIIFGPQISTYKCMFCSLTLGLMGLDELHLRVLATSSDNPVERRNAGKGTCPIFIFHTHTFPPRCTKSSH
jgi:hypothetical protein